MNFWTKSVFTFYCVLFMYPVQCTMYCEVCSVYCVLRVPLPVYCVLCTTCTVTSVPCTVYRVLCTVYCLLDEFVYIPVYCILEFEEQFIIHIIITTVAPGGQITEAQGQHVTCTAGMLRHITKQTVKGTVVVTSREPPFKKRGMTFI